MFSLTVRPVNVRFEHHPNGFGIGTATPRISWQLTSADVAFEAVAYELELTGPRGVEFATSNSSEQALVRWPFAPLASRERASVRVRVASSDGWTEWSEPRTVETGLLDPSDWSAVFVTPREIGVVGSAAPVVGCRFLVRGPIASARLYTTALGVYEARLNHRRIGDEVLAPGWTSYKKRLCYQTFDVTALLVEGENTLEALLGNGWYRGQLTWLKRRDFYGDRLAYLAQLELSYADGSVQRGCYRRVVESSRERGPGRRSL